MRNDLVPAQPGSLLSAPGLLACLISCVLLLGTAAPPARAAQIAEPGKSSGPSQAQPIRMRHAMVVSVHHLAADAGVAVLREGGNAIDAAVATGFALAVVYPEAGNLGGGGFMLIRLHTGRATFIDYREKAPAAATANMYLDAKGNVVPDASTVGYHAIGVPGSVAGMVYAERKYGRLGLKRVMAPALQLAREGYVLSREEAEMLHEPALARFADSRRIFQRQGSFYTAGETFRQPELTLTLERIANDPDDFYRGELSRQIAAAIQKGGGLITASDMAAYVVKEREPVVGTYKSRGTGEDFTVISAPLPSSGGVALIEMLNMLEGYDLQRLGDRSPEKIHLVGEAFRRAYMDRGDYLGDSDFSPVPVQQLISKTYAAAWRMSIEPEHASSSASLHRPSGFLPPPPRAASLGPEPTETTHYSVVDRQGNAVSVTTTLNDEFGSGVTAEGLGFLLNNEMDDFEAKPGVPNLYGLIQGPANAIAPGKRPLSSMTPTIVLAGTGENARLRMVLGSPGGSRIPTTVANILLSVTDGGLNIQQAVDAPRFHMQYLPDTIHLEPGFPEPVLRKLRAMGYSLDIGKDGWTDGECISVELSTGALSGGQDKRHSFGKAAGY
ncbi:MAG TPA: gamma-glutamyltransferase [Acidisarcina sp.]